MPGSLHPLLLCPERQQPGHCNCSTSSSRTQTAHAFVHAAGSLVKPAWQSGARAPIQSTLRLLYFLQQNSNSPCLCARMTMEVTQARLRPWAKTPPASRSAATRRAMSRRKRVGVSPFSSSSDRTSGSSSSSDPPPWPRTRQKTLTAYFFSCLRTNPFLAHELKPTHHHVKTKL